MVIMAQSPRELEIVNYLVLNQCVCGYLSVCMTHTGECLPHQKGIGSPAADAIGSCEPWVLVPNSGSLEEQQARTLPTEPSLHPPIVY